MSHRIARAALASSTIHEQQHLSSQDEYIDLTARFKLYYGFNPGQLPPGRADRFIEAILRMKMLYVGVDLRFFAIVVVGHRVVGFHQQINE